MTEDLRDRLRMVLYARGAFDHLSHQFDRIALADSIIDGVLPLVREAQAAQKFQTGDRVVYSGPVVNEAWPADRQGVVLGVHTVERIDIQWDVAGINEGQDARDFTFAADIRAAKGEA